jgi:hypothetical protein
MRSHSSSRLAAGALLAVAFACKPAPHVGAPDAAAAVGPELVLTAAKVEAVEGVSRVVVTYTVAKDGVPATADVAAGFAPAFTLAGLGDAPDGSEPPAWRSYLLNGAVITTGVRQPGYETGGTVTDLGNGTFTYAFATPLPADAAEYGPATTLRVGAFLRAVNGTPRTTSTIDFVADGTTPASRELVLDSACASCHVVLRAHENTRVGPRVCVTCHTFQHADPQTLDPAVSADGAGAALPAGPNPLELGRLVHRIHRGKYLPTLYKSSSTDAAPDFTTATTLPLPFATGRTSTSAATATRPNEAELGRKFVVVGELGRERVFGRIVNRTDNGQAALRVVEGVTFPRDLRSCDVCHPAAAKDSALVDIGISRRSCQSCHADVWFGANGPPDAWHFAHTGGRRDDDTQCAGCHVRSTSNPDPIAPIADIHVPPLESPRMNQPTIRIVGVENLAPGKHPTVVFKVWDRTEPEGMTSLYAPVPANDDDATAPSPVPRWFKGTPTQSNPDPSSGISFTFAGPPGPDFRRVKYPATKDDGSPILASDGVTPTSWEIPLSESIKTSVLAALVPDSEGRYRYTLTAKLPEDASGTWAVFALARRSSTPKHFDATTLPGKFAWPYTGESVTELADTDVQWVDLASRGWPGGNPVPRRKIVSMDKCNVCHLRRVGHGSRTAIEMCVVCHTGDKTDWDRRTKAAGNVNLAATYDNVEERTVHLKVMIHRMHTGGRSGPAELGFVRPFMIYGYAGARFYDRGEFPGLLARCVHCHEAGTYRVESVPRDADPTVANEEATIRHAATAEHADDERHTPPIQAACQGCHATWDARFHSELYTVNGVEGCGSCHAAGMAWSVDAMHGLE